MFDREQAVRTWRNAVLAGGGLTVDDVDELQEHLEHVEEDLSDRLHPEEAFWVAAHRVGTPEALTREYRKVRPNAGWLLRAQWALLGMLAYWLLVPAGLLVVHLIIAGLALVEALAPLAAAGMLYAYPLALALVVATLLFIVRRFALDPERLERALLMVGSPPRPTLLLAVLVVAGWQAGAGAATTAAMNFTYRLIGTPGTPAALQSDIWSMISHVMGYLLPVVALMLVVRLQRQRQRMHPTTR